jgi:Flp pilus assembly protein CpaB
MSGNQQASAINEPVQGPKRLLWIAILLGVAAAFANFVFVQRVQGSRLTVLKATRRIPSGSKVDSGMFTVIPIYGDLNEMKSLVVEEKDFSVFAQMSLAEAIEPGQLLLQGSFRFDGNRGLRDLIRPDERAIAVQVKDETSAVGYFVRPGDKVDVYIRVEGQRPDNIIPNAIVRAVGDAAVVPSDSGGRDLRYRSVTVVVPNSILPNILYKLDLGKGNVVLALTGASPE